jgi:hypothetical protein
MLRRITLGLILLLLVFSGIAQRTYSEQNLRRLSDGELFLYQQKSLELQKKGEFLIITGAGVGLLGIVLGTLAADNNSSDAGSNALTITAAAMYIGGAVAEVIGLPIFFTGYSRVNRIYKIQNAESLRLELIPDSFYCKHTKNYQTGVTLRLRF